MGFQVKVEGAESFSLGVKSIISVNFAMNTPLDSNARSTDLGAEAIITGKILTTLEGDPEDATKKMALWSLVPAENANCYRNVTIDVIAAGQTVRNVVVPNAFVINYTEDYGDSEGIGTFSLHIKQKKDLTKNYAINGNYATPAAE